MQRLVRSLTHTRLVRWGGVTHNGSAYSNQGVACPRMAAAYSLQSGPSLLQKHFEFMGLQAEDSCRTRADHSLLVGMLPADPAISAGRLQNWRFRSAFSYPQKKCPCLDYAGRRDHVGVQAFLQSSRGYSSCNTSILDCEFMETVHLRTEENNGEDKGDDVHVPDHAHNSVDNPAIKYGLLTRDELADKLVSAVTDLDLVDMQQVRSQLCLRYRKTPPETFFSDLQKKVELLNLQSSMHPVWKILVKKKNFLFASLENTQAVFEVLKDFFGSGEKACSVLARSSSLIAKPVEGLRGMLKLIVEFGIEKQAVESSSGVLTCDSDRARDVLTFLNAWGIHNTGLSRMIRRDYHFVQFMVEENARAVLNFLQSVGASKPVILGILQARPDVLLRSVDKNLALKHKLCQQWQLNFSIVIRHISYQSQERTLSQIEFFREHGFSDEAIVKLLEREPRILGKSRKDLKLKLDYLLRTHKRNMSDVVNFPACLCYSYKYRIVPRLNFLNEKGVLHSLCLSYMLALRESQFRTAFKVPESVKLT